MGDVLGCGLMMSNNDKLSIFFTGNGILMGFYFVNSDSHFNATGLTGNKLPISPTVDRLFPTVTISWNNSLAANFGEVATECFQYDIKTSPGLDFE
jgi:hypothetical protein